MPVSGDPDTGIYAPAADQVGLTAAGTGGVLVRAFDVTLSKSLYVNGQVRAINGGFDFMPDNTADIGQFGNNRPRTIYAGTSFIGPGAAPAGGTAGQMLSKVDATDYNLAWATPFTQAAADARYLTPATAASTYLPLVGGTLSGDLNISTGSRSLFVYGVGQPGDANYERLRIWNSGTDSYIQTEQSGTGVSRNLIIGMQGNAGSLIVKTSNIQRWNFNSAGHMLASTDNSYDIGASAASRPRYAYVGTGVITPTVGTSLVQSATTLQLGASNNPKWRIHTTGDLWAEVDNAYDIGASTGVRPRDVFIARNLDVKGVTTHPDLGADTPATKFSGMTAFGGRLNIGGLGGADRIGFMVTGINTPSTTLMSGSTQTLWYAEYWSNDANTGVLNGMDFGVIGPPSVKVQDINLMRLRGVGSRALGPNIARGLKVETITNGTQANFGIEVLAPGTTGSSENYAIKAAGNSLFQGDVRIGNPYQGYLTAVSGSNPGVGLASFSGQTALAGQVAQLAGNAWWTGNAWSRMVTGASTVLNLTGGSFQFYSAPSAGAAVPPALAVVASIDAAGNMDVANNFVAHGVVTAGSFRQAYYVAQAGGTYSVPAWSSFTVVTAAATSVYLPAGGGRAGDSVIVKNWSAGNITVFPQGGSVIGLPDGTAVGAVTLGPGNAYTFMSDGGAGMMVVSRAL